MSLHIGDIAPNFRIDSSQGEIDFHKWAAGSWVFFFSHPADFTPVCTTEMGRTAQLASEFAARNTKSLGLSLRKMTTLARRLFGFVPSSGDVGSGRPDCRRAVPPQGLWMYLV